MVKTMNKTRFSEILELPIEVQLLWLGWRDEQMIFMKGQTVFDNTACPLKSCRAIEGQECRTRSDMPAVHMSRCNEHLARLWLDSQATQGAKSQAISSGKYPNG